MIVDDSSVDRKLIRKIIEMSNETIEIIECENADNLLDKVVMQDVKVVILDLILGQQSGLEVLSELKNHTMTHDIPVIIFSGVSDVEVIKEALNLSAFDYFEKPLTQNDIDFALAMKVNNALKQKLHIDHINYLMNHDIPTGLYSRSYMENELKNLTERMLPIGLLLLDINGLKVINDAYGYDAGDHIIKYVGMTLNHFVHQSQCIARWGSDEFAIVLTETSKSTIDQMILEINDHLKTNDTVGFDVAYGYTVIHNFNHHLNEWIRLAEDNLASHKVISDSSHRSELIKSIGNTLYQKNPREESHSSRVSEISKKIVRELGLSEFEIKRAEIAGFMHDIGKIAIDEAILNKSGKLTDEEWHAMKKHPEIGFRILSTSVDTIDIANAVLSHHERFDGNGYPMGLKAEEIPFLARVITVADAFDAMTSYRTYKDEMTYDEAVNEIMSCAGSQFDPVIVKAFIQVYDKNLI